jgi:hypothetical protein
VPLSSSTGQAFLKQINNGSSFTDQQQHQGTNLPPVNGLMDSAKMRSEKDGVNHTTTSVRERELPENTNATPNGNQVTNSDLRDPLQQNYQNPSSKFSTQSQQPPSATSN